MTEMNPQEFFCKFNELKKQNEQKRPYNMNLLDELHANENAHSRILMKLLSFSVGKEYPIFEKFVSILNEKLENSFKIQDFHAPIFEGQFAFIDVYIYEKTKQSLIIENKIEWATDQDKQLERYIESSKNADIPENKIYVIYLTDDGRKKASNYSLTEKAKSMLCVTANNNGRYIELNYRDDVLPFLKDILAYLDFSKEVYLKTALVQYIDYLEGRYGIREREKAYFESMTKGLKELLSIQDSDTATIIQKETVYNKINEFKERLADELKKTSEENHCLIANVEPYLNALNNEIYPEKMQPKALARKVLFTFANKDKQIIDNSTPFTTGQIIWANPNMHNIVIFGTKSSVLNIVFTTEQIEFHLRSEFSQREQLKEFFVNYRQLSFEEKEDFVFTLPYEKHYQNIIDELKTLFAELKNCSFW